SVFTNASLMVKPAIATAISSAERRFAEIVMSEKAVGQGEQAVDRSATGGAVYRFRRLFAIIGCVDGELRQHETAVVKYPLAAGGGVGDTAPCGKAGDGAGFLVEGGSDENRRGRKAEDGDGV